MKINYALLHNMNETHISFEAIRPSYQNVSERDILYKQKTNKRKNNVVRGFKRNYVEGV